MNGAHAPIFLRFLRRVHRRLVAVRLLEWAGAGLLAGCAAAAGLIPVLLWNGRPAWGAAGWAAAVGVMAGLAWGLGRRPRMLDAAIEADQQLRLADLLGTAWCLHGRHDDNSVPMPWAASVLAMADARCAGLSPAAAVLRRFGARAWGGIGLATAMVLALASLSTNSSTTLAGGTGLVSNPARPQQATARLPNDRPIAGAPWDAPSRRRVGPTEGTDERRRGMPLPLPEADRPDATATASEPRDRRGQSAAGTDGGGSGMARGNGNPAVATKPPVPSNPPRSDASRPPLATASGIADGPGRSPQTSEPGLTPDLGNHDAASAGARADVPPWRSDTWASDVSRARIALDAGRVPVAYRDLVRRYFDRP